MLTYPVGFFSARGYTANAVRFDGSDYIARGGNLTGAADGKLGILSFWFKLTGGAGSDTNFFTGDPSTLQITKEGGDSKLLIVGSTEPPSWANRIRMRPNTAFAVSSTWHHLAAAWDVGNTVEWLFIDGSDDLAGGSTNSDGYIDYHATDVIMGGAPGGTKLLDAEIADFYFNQAEVLDLSVAANMLKLRSADGKPANLGDDGSKVTGTSPIVFFSGDTATWHVNKGTGGAFSLTGVLTTASDSPSD